MPASASFVTSWTVVPWEAVAFEALLALATTELEAETPLVPVVTLIVIAGAVPAPMLAAVHVTTCEAAEHDQPVPELETYASELSSVVATETVVAAAAPLFVSVTLYEYASPPLMTGSAESVIETDSTGIAASIAESMTCAAPTV
jgi:hypothetical protein